jgi:flagellar biosynthetic protein FlhB
VIAAIDVPFQLYQYHDRLKMTREELRQESKESEGDPHLKASIRSQQREMARGRMMAEVPKADVVVTNPTHFAVALKYDGGAHGGAGGGGQGMNLIAERIRELAWRIRCRCSRRRPWRAPCYRHAEVGRCDSGRLYTAVAEVMAWVYPAQCLRQGRR